MLDDLGMGETTPRSGHHFMGEQRDCLRMTELDAERAVATPQFGRAKYR